MRTGAALCKCAARRGLGYHVASREQRFGIDGYDVVWLRPADGSNSPMAVYLRAMPTGFPQLKERTQAMTGPCCRKKSW